jgi:hypothetical protein
LGRWLGVERWWRELLGKWRGGRFSCLAFVKRDREMGGWESERVRDAIADEEDDDNKIYPTI